MLGLEANKVYMGRFFQLSIIVGMAELEFWKMFFQLGSYMDVGCTDLLSQMPLRSAKGTILIVLGERGCDRSSSLEYKTTPISYGAQ